MLAMYGTGGHNNDSEKVEELRRHRRRHGRVQRLQETTLESTTSDSKTIRAKSTKETLLLLLLDGRVNNDDPNPMKPRPFLLYVAAAVAAVGQDKSMNLSLLVS